MRQRRIVAGRDSIVGRVALEGRVVHVKDIRADPDYADSESCGVRATYPPRGAAAARRRPILGMISLARKRVEPFTERQIELVRTFADQAVIAIENARLLGELQARTRDLEESLEYQTATSDVLNVISRSTADVQPVLDTVVETAARLCGADLRNDHDTRGRGLPLCGELRSVQRNPSIGRSCASEPLSPVATASPGGWRSKAGSCMSRTSSLIRTTRCPRLWRPGYVPSLGCRCCARASRARHRLISTRKRVEPFTERQIELVRTFADQAVIAIENARLLGELQTRTRDLEELLEYQTATSDVLKVISRSTFDLQPMLDTLVETGAAALRQPIAASI